MSDDVPPAPITNCIALVHVDGEDRPCGTCGLPGCATSCLHLQADVLPSGMHGLISAEEWREYAETINAAMDRSLRPTWPLALVCPLWLCISHPARGMTTIIDASARFMSRHPEISARGLRLTGGLTVLHYGMRVWLVWSDDTRPQYEAAHPAERKVSEEDGLLAFCSSWEDEHWKRAFPGHAWAKTGRIPNARAQQRQLEASHSVANDALPPPLYAAPESEHMPPPYSPLAAGAIIPSAPACA